mgnify:CR=1 FL=1
MLKLFAQDRKRLSRRPFRLGFPDANDGRKSGGQSGLGLRRHDPTRFAVAMATFGMADDDIATSRVGEHRRRNIAGMRTLGLNVTILPADRHRRVAEFFAYGRQQGEGRANQKFAGSSRRISDGRDAFGEAQPIGAQPVHFPVSGNKLARHGETPSRHLLGPSTCPDGEPAYVVARCTTQSTAHVAAARAGA